MCKDPTENLWNKLVNNKIENIGKRSSGTFDRWI